MQVIEPGVHWGSEPCSSLNRGSFDIVPIRVSCRLFWSSKRSVANMSYLSLADGLPVDSGKMGSGFVSAGRSVSASPARVPHPQGSPPQLHLARWTLILLDICRLTGSGGRGKENNT